MRKFIAITWPLIVRTYSEKTLYFRPLPDVNLAIPLKLKRDGTLMHTLSGLTFDNLHSVVQCLQTSDELLVPFSDEEKDRFGLYDYLNRCGTYLFDSPNEYEQEHNLKAKLKKDKSFRAIKFICCGFPVSPDNASALVEYADDSFKEIFVVKGYHIKSKLCSGVKCAVRPMCKRCEHLRKLLRKYLLQAKARKRTANVIDDVVHYFATCDNLDGINLKKLKHPKLKKCPGFPRTDVPERLILETSWICESVQFCPIKVDKDSEDVTIVAFSKNCLREIDCLSTSCCRNCQRLHTRLKRFIGKEKSITDVIDTIALDDDFFATKSTSNSSHPYICNTCGRTFRWMCYLKYHFEMDHTGYMEKLKEIAEQKALKDKQQAEEEKLAKQKEKLTCKLCSLMFTFVSNLQRHMATVHCDDRKHVCTKCGMSYKLKEKLKQHLSRCNGKMSTLLINCMAKNRKRCSLKNKVEYCSTFGDTLLLDTDIPVCETLEIYENDYIAAATNSFVNGVANI